MRFHGLLLVRDESDIIEEMIRDTATWADTIWALDTGSTDGTDLILQKLADEFPQLQFLGRHEIIFDQSIRSLLFDIARSKFTEGDWVVKLDADEFYHYPPPEFVKCYVQPCYGVIELKWYYFRLTQSEALAFEAGEINIDEDRKRSISERRRFYKRTTHREPRLFRYRETMRFSEANNSPSFAGPVCPHPIPVRHYPHRDSRQMQRRFELRSMMISLGSSESGHWRASAWENDLVQFDGTEHSSSELVKQSGHADGPLYHWAIVEDLPDLINDANYRSRKYEIVKKILYPRAYAIFDLFAPKFTEFDMLVRRAQNKKI